MDYSKIGQIHAKPDRGIAANKKKLPQKLFLNFQATSSAKIFLYQDIRFL